MICKIPCEVYSRIVGYFRPVSNWNGGKRAEFMDRLEYNVAKSLEHKLSVSPVEIRMKTKTKEKVAAAA